MNPAEPTNRQTRRRPRNRMAQMPIRNSRPTLCGDPVSVGPPQRDGCVVFVSPHPCVHLAQMGDSKRADNSECLTYSVGPEIGNRRTPHCAPAHSIVGRRGTNMLRRSPYIKAFAPATNLRSLSVYDVGRGDFPGLAARPCGEGRGGAEPRCRRICLVRPWGYDRHKRVWWYRSSRVRPWPRCRPVRPGLPGATR